MTHAEYMREWRKKRIETPEQAERRREKCREATQRFWNRHPWCRTLSRIQSRCSSQYKKYNIKCEITKEELRELWFRDKAFLMKNPSIDRIDTYKGYTKENCRYMEKIANTKRQFEPGGRSHWRMK